MKTLGAALLSLLAAAGCSEPCCTLDSQPIPLQRGPGGELLIGFDTGGDQPGLGVVDTGTPITLFRALAPRSPPLLQRRTLRLLGAPPQTPHSPVRAVLHGVVTIEAALGSIGSPADNFVPSAVIGGDVWRSFSLEIGFATPYLTFWQRQPASDGFLGGAGYAVIHLPRHGGGELEALDPEDKLGQQGPHQVPPSKLVMRACAAPDAFKREDPRPARCCVGDERRLATGTDLSLVLATGIGPLVLGRAAWERVRARLGAAAPPVGEIRPLFAATVARPVSAEWTQLPRLAVVAREAGPADDPGPCVELGRARRLEQVALSQSQNSALAACAQRCDAETGSRRAQNTAAYLELGDAIEVAIVEDTEPLLQSVRAEVRPEGPEVDGLLGASVLQRVRVELDYLGSDARAIFSCQADAPVDRCRAVPRCPRLPSKGQMRACFGLPAHGLPQMCEDSPDSCGS